MSSNPLNRSRAIVHLPLLVLGAVFGFPLIWLILTSLQPREQVGKIPPEWLPRQSYIMRGSEKVMVTPPGSSMTAVATDRNVSSLMDTDSTLIRKHRPRARTPGARGRAGKCCPEGLP